MVDWSDCGVYAIRNTVTDQVYVGSAYSFKNRWSRHRQELILGTHCNPKLQASWNKYGKDAFVFEVLAYCSKGDVLIFEQLGIDAFDSYNKGFNLCSKAGSRAGTTQSSEARERIRLSMMGKTNRKGQSNSEEHSLAIGIAMKGNQYAKGHCRSGYTLSPSHLTNLSESHKGYVWSEESKARLRANTKGRPGRKSTVVTRQAMRDGWAKRKLKLQAF
jgi:group I intron endonuclease